MHNLKAMYIKSCKHRPYRHPYAKMAIAKRPQKHSSDKRCMNWHLTAQCGDYSLFARMTTMTVHTHTHTHTLYK